MNSTIFDINRPPELRSTHKSKSALTGTALKEFVVESRHSDSPLIFYAKIPSTKHAGLGIRLYGPESINVDDLVELQQALKLLDIAPDFQRLYFNILHFRGEAGRQAPKGFRCIDKIERALCLRDFWDSGRHPLKLSDYRIERLRPEAAAKSSSLLELNRAFHGCSALDLEWMVTQYIRPSVNGQHVLIFLACAKNDEIVGFADAILSDPNEQVAMQRNTFVAEHHRNLGIGGSLKSELISCVAQTTDYRWVMAHNELDDQQMTRLSDKLGFRGIQEYKRIEGEM